MQQKPAESTAAPAASANPMGEEYRGVRWRRRRAANAGGGILALHRPAGVPHPLRGLRGRSALRTAWALRGRSLPSRAPGSSSTASSMAAGRSTRSPSFMLRIPSPLGVPSLRGCEPRARPRPCAVRARSRVVLQPLAAAGVVTQPLASSRAVSNIPR
ncbi:hypothetical protein GQ55_4G194700 [Panicum hallii var. hallii]|uniref:Uncharacterized protein n=1 Tax=Panicum hallii var. hallii TaxID=1504633 RepID=A0A2T7DZ15_9POAL|nr:hypothetical protein GQ55_4G194700 [Panicum hallii var. hallii]